jgi:hypothetical protein
MDPAATRGLRYLGLPRSFPGRREEEGEALPQMNDGQLTHPEPDPAPQSPFTHKSWARHARVQRAGASVFH